MDTVIVAGGGMAGLTAAIYAQKSGFRVTLYEAHGSLGGNCSGWRRGGYHFEGGLHWLNGSGPSKTHHRLWREVGALNDTTRVINTDPFMVCDHPLGRVSLFRDVEKFERRLLEISPADASLIKDMCTDARRFGRLGVPVMDLPGLRVRNRSPSVFSLLKQALPILPCYFRLSGISAGDYAARFRHPAIRLLLSRIVNPDLDSVSLFYILGSFLSGDGGYVEGGSKKLISNMEAYFISLGGLVKKNAGVDRVLIREGRAAGIIRGGNSISAGAVILAMDTRAAIDRLFEEPIREAWADKMRRTETAFITSTYVSIGVEADLSGIPEIAVIPLERPFTLGGFTVDSLVINNYASHPSYAPPGSSALTVSMAFDTYDYWKKMKEEGRYGVKKREIFETLRDRLEEYYPLMRGKIRVWDVATPLTYERYCGSYRGSWMTKTPPGHGRTIYPSKSKTIRDLYFAGHRLQPPGGLPIALITGRRAAQHLCRDFGAAFG
jgi:phytoene dehydrogenase-like protein